MAIIATATQMYSNLVKREFEPEWGYCKKMVTLKGAVSAGLPIGAVLGAFIDSPTITAGTMVGTGNATVGTASVTAHQFLKVGTYTVGMLTATTFVVLDPEGDSIGSGSTTVAFKSNGLVFTVTAGATPAVAGDTIPVVIDGTVKYKLVEATATDGTQNAKVVVVGDAQGAPRSQAVVVNTDTKFLVLYRGPAAVADSALTYGASVNAAGEIALVKTQLEAAGIDVLTQL